MNKYLTINGNVYPISMETIDGLISKLSLCVNFESFVYFTHISSFNGESKISIDGRSNTLSNYDLHDALVKLKKSV